MPRLTQSMGHPQKSRGVKRDFGPRAGRGPKHRSDINISVLLKHGRK